MSRTATIDVDPGLIRWARESAGLSLPETARKVGVAPGKLEAWEVAASQPTARQLERLADAVKRPIVAFFLPFRPAEPALPVDFRVTAGTARPELSPAVRLAIRRARRVVRIYRELGGGASHAPLTITRRGPVEITAARAREALGVSLHEQASWGSAKVALEQWREALEALGVLVLQLNLPHETVSGFSLHEETPAIVLNKSDHESRRCFTLFHEWAHLLLGEPGLCSVDEGHVFETDERVESYCNAFAAEALVPLHALQEAGLTPAVAEHRLPLERAVEAATARFGVSRWVVLIRLLTARAISREQFRRTADAWRAQGPAPEPTGGRSYPHKKALQSLGVPFVSRVMAALESGLVTTADASDYLGLKLRWFADLEALLPGR